MPAARHRDRTGVGGDDRARAGGHGAQPGVVEPGAGEHDENAVGHRPAVVEHGPRAAIAVLDPEKRHRNSRATFGACSGSNNGSQGGISHATIPLPRR